MTSGDAGQRPTALGDAGQQPVLPGGSWERLAAYEGGTVAALALAREPAADSGREPSVEAAGLMAAETVFAGTPAGVFRSHDGGRSWCPAGPVGVLPFVTSVAVSPDYARDRTVFAGTWGGLFRSRDGGDSWQPVLAGGTILAVVVSPAFAEDGTLLVGTAEDGILRSVDGGDRWLSANAGLLDLAVTTLAISGRFAEDGTTLAGTASGLYWSQNGGQSWREVDLGLDADLDLGSGPSLDSDSEPGEVSVQALGLGGRRPGGWWIAVGTEAHGLRLSDDGGLTWLAVPDLEGQSIGAIEIEAGADGSARLLVATDRAVLRSDDEGVSWQTVAELPAPILSLLSRGGHAGEAGGRQAGEPLVGLAGDGIVRLPATGGPPIPSNAGLAAAPLSMLAVSPDFATDGTLLAASADGTVLVSRDGGRTLERIDLGVEATAITGLAFSEAGAAWVATPDGLLRSQDGGQTWEPLPPGARDVEPGRTPEASVEGLALGAGATLWRRRDQ
jgi:photosystem II stability/assembly factor-like uncharacterized protein